MSAATMPNPTQRDRYVDADAPPEERTYAMFTHLAGMIGVITAPIPLAGPLAALVMWRIKAHQSPFLDDHGRDAMNFQLSLLLYAVVLGVLTVGTLGIASPLYFLTIILCLVGCIRGAIAANAGAYYRYPMTIRFLKP